MAHAKDDGGGGGEDEAREERSKEKKKMTKVKIVQIVAVNMPFRIDPPETFTELYGLADDGRIYHGQWIFKPELKKSVFSWYPLDMDGLPGWE